MTAISVVINTLNEGAQLRACLESVRWAAEIIVVDMHSEDATVKIAGEFGCRVFQHERMGYVEPARNFAIAQASHAWVLILDADERVSTGLAEWAGMNLEAATFSAVRIPRRNFYGERWIRCCGWFPDNQLRLFRRGQVQYSDRIHRAPKINGAILDLPDSGEAYLAHFGFNTLGARLEKDNKYAAIVAVAMAEEGRQIGAIGLLSRTTAAFCTAYFFQGGIWNGMFGVVLAWERAFATFSKYAKLWELQAARKVAK
jgi:glycosyltransferase involved in cell wall biosynthesis